MANKEILKNEIKLVQTKHHKNEENISWFLKSYIAYKNFLTKYWAFKMIIGLIMFVAEFLTITFIILMITFFLIDAAPGKPSITSSLPASSAAAIEAKYHLTDSSFTRLFAYIKGLFHGDLGVSLSIFAGVPINEFIWERFATSAVIGLLAILVTLPLGIGLGVWAGRKITGWSSVASTLFIAVMISIPSMVFGLLLLLLARYMGLPYFYDSHNFLTYIAPVLALALAPSITYIKYIRTTMNDEIESQHAKFAHMKGCTTRRFIWVHALKPSLFPVATFFPSAIVSVFIGGLFIERIFLIPGSGFLMTEAGQTKDTFVLLFLIMINTLMVIVSFAARDALYKLLDPRLRRRG